MDFGCISYCGWLYFSHVMPPLAVQITETLCRTVMLLWKNLSSSLPWTYASRIYVALTNTRNSVLYPHNLQPKKRNTYNYTLTQYDSHNDARILPIGINLHSYKIIIIIPDPAVMPVELEEAHCGGVWLLPSSWPQQESYSVYTQSKNNVWNYSWSSDTVRSWVLQKCQLIISIIIMFTNELS